MIRRFFSFAILASAAALVGCSTIEVASIWRSTPVRVDGQLNEWTDRSAFVEQNGLRMAVRNDGTFLFVALETSAAEGPARPSLWGMTIWFDGAGGTTKQLGIRYPLRPSVEAEGAWRERPQGSQPRLRDAAVSELTAEFEWLGSSEEDVERVPVLNRDDVEVAFSRTPEGAGYELKVPLVRSGAHRYAIEATPGSVIGLGVEVGIGPGDTRPSGGAGMGRGEGRAGMRRGDRRGEELPNEPDTPRAPRMKSETTWFTVRLSAS